jgi:hypothetical protein
LPRIDDDDVHAVASPTLLSIRSHALPSCNPSFDPNNVTDAAPVNSPLVATPLLQLSGASYE